MLETKDFATGCLTILLCVILLPLFFLVFKLTLILAQRCPVIKLHSKETIKKHNILSSGRY